jgi:hypothetical protein
MATLQQLEGVASPVEGIEASVQRWLDAIVTSAAPGTLFSVNRTIELLYGAPRRSDFATDRGLVEYALRFANGRSNRSEMQRYVDLKDEVIKYASGHAINPAFAILAMVTGRRPDAAILAETYAVVIAQLRAKLCELLSSVAHDRARAAADFLAAAAGADPLGRTWVRARVVPGRTGLSRQYHVVLNAPADFTAFLSLLLFDESLNIGRNLCHCKLIGCDRFFLAPKPNPKGGLQRRSYCKRAHMLEAHALGSAERVRQSRQQRKHK